jgi:CheY-like chemotaxis protein
MRRKKILLIDDSETILMLEKMFLRLDYDLITAKDGRSGIAKALTEKPDLVVLDLVMPGMSGSTVCRMLRSEEATKDIPIVMVTSENAARSMESCYRSGCTAFIKKPIDGPQLLAAVKSCLGVSGKCE